MERYLDDQLCAECPNLYADRVASIMDTCMAWGFDCMNGWFSIIRDLSLKLEAIIAAMPEEERAQYKAVQVKEKFGCYDEQTEVLTLAGWKHFGVLTVADKLATLAKPDILVYQKPLDLIAYNYEGQMYHLVTRGVDLLVTPNHNLYVAKGTYYNGRHSSLKKIEFPFEFATPDKYFGRNKRFLKSALWKGKEPPFFVLPGYEHEWNRGKRGKTRKICPVVEMEIESWLRFLGWYIAEGCCDSDTGQISIACNNTDGGCERFIVEQVIRKVGFELKPHMEDRSALVFRIYRKQLAVWLAEHCGCNAATKMAPSFVKGLSSRLIVVFLDALFSGDGCLQNTSHILTTVSKRLADDVQELILKAGYTSRVYQPRSPKTSNLEGRKVVGKHVSYEVNWLKNSNSHNTSDKGLAPHSIECWESYNGKVYCATVPNHLLYVRRNGKPVWCGNSLRFYMTAETDEMEKLIDEAESASAITCEYCGQPGKLRNTGWLFTLCDKCDEERPWRKR